jgi:hypothetical protein
MKLIFQHTWGVEGWSGTSIIPFEYESKEKFLFDLFEKFNADYWKDNPWNCQIFYVYVSKSEFNSIEQSIYTLDEWFEQSKEIAEIYY